MRKLLIGLTITLVLLLVALIAIPPLFGERILDAALEAANEQLGATVEIDAASLSLLRSFPNPSLGLEGITVSGQGEFAGVQLASIEQLRLTIGLASALGGATELRELTMVEPSFHLVVGPDGAANWDIAPDEQPEAGTPSPEPSSFSVDLRKIRIDGLDLSYQDQQSGMLVELAGLEHRGSGSVAGEVLSFDNHTSIAAFSYRDGGVTMLREVQVEAELPLIYHLDSGRLELGESRLALNQLALGFQGSVAPQGDDLAIDLGYRVLDTSFRSILSLIPGVYTQDFADVQTSGSLALAGSVKGVLPAEGDDLPGFVLELELRDASFTMPDLPSGVDDISVDLSVGHPGGDPDLMVVDLERFAMSVAGSPLEGRLKLRHPSSDPDVELEAKGRVDLAQISRALPLDGIEYSGVLELDMAVAGRVSQFESDRLDKVQSTGTLSLRDMLYKDQDLPLPVAISRFSCELGPSSTEISELALTMGDSDLTGSGRLDNLVPWFFSDAPLAGHLSLRSRRFDTNPWLADDPESEEPEAEADESSLVAVPTNLDLRLDGRFDRVLYEELELTDMVGSLRLAGGAARIDSLTFHMLGGRVGVSGSYVAPTEQRADVELDIELADLGVSEVATSFETVRIIAPVAQNTSGRFSADFTLDTALGADLSPDIPTLISAGLLSSRSLELRPEFMAKVGAALGNDRLSSIDLARGDVGFRITGGRAVLAPFAVAVGGGKGTLQGSTGVLDQSLDLVLDLEVPAKAIQDAALISQLGVARGGKLPLQVVVGGSFDRPTISVGAPGLVEAVRGSVTEQVQERIGAVVDDLLAEARVAGDALVAEAERKRDQLVSVATAAGDELVEQAKAKAQRLEDQAEGNALKEAAASEAAKLIRKEARQARKKLISEAEEKGDALIEAARSKRDELIAQAEAKAGG